jgi:hypothetical protein
MHRAREKCLLFLQAARLSKITRLEGTSIDSTAWNGAACLTSHHGDWPRQDRPSRLHGACGDAT